MFWNRIVGVFKLNVATFEEVEHDSSATSQAAIVVAIVDKDVADEASSSP